MNPSWANIIGIFDDGSVQEDLKDLLSNQFGRVNTGEYCKCSNKTKGCGINHNYYAGENTYEFSNRCNLKNNCHNLHHYTLYLNPITNILDNDLTRIHHDGIDYEFQGFSLFSHYKIEEIENFQFTRYHVSHSVTIKEQPCSLNIDLKDWNRFEDHLFKNILELLDWDIRIDKSLPKYDTNGEYCNTMFHFIPIFARRSSKHCDLLPAEQVLEYFRSNLRLVDSYLQDSQSMTKEERDKLIFRWKNSIMTNPNKKPRSFRLDQIERADEKYDNSREKSESILIHMSCQSSSNYSTCPKYQKMLRQYQKLKHLLVHKAIQTKKDKAKLGEKERELRETREKYQTKKYQAISVSSLGYYTTGIKIDVVQYATILPVLTARLRFHRSLRHLETKIGYVFRDKSLLQKALTHPSYSDKYGTNPDHVRNVLTNCGLRNPYYGDKVPKNNSHRKRGIVLLNRIMKVKGHERDRSEANYDNSGGYSESNSKDIVMHNERLEFLGDAVLEFLTTVHLFFTFPYIEEGGLAVYRAALVQNYHLAELAKGIELEKFILYAHGPDLCHESDLNHAMSNAFEALLGAMFLDGGIQPADSFLSNSLFGDDEKLFEVWTNLSRHPLQEDEPAGDRHWIEKVPVLSKFTTLEQQTGLRFNHIRLLARAFTLRSTGHNNLTLGHNQRLEFLGDTILQLITSEYLYIHFPTHHEGHLSLLRSCLVNNQTQAEVSNDLGLSLYIISSNENIELTTKDRADLLESLIGAIYVDQGIESCKVLFQVCFVSRLDHFIENQSWNDPKSLLQQCCLTLRNLDGKEPDVPIYKVIDSMGPSNERRFKVGVYFRENRLAVAWGRSKQQAEMEAAQLAVKTYKSVFPQYTQGKAPRN